MFLYKVCQKIKRLLYNVDPVKIIHLKREINILTARVSMTHWVPREFHFIPYPNRQLFLWQEKSDRLGLTCSCVEVRLYNLQVKSV